MNYKLKENEILKNVKNHIYDICENGGFSIFKERFDDEITLYEKGNFALLFEYLLGSIRTSLKNVGLHSFTSMTYGSSFISYLFGVAVTVTLLLSRMQKG